ncbi:MFS transporter [Pseudoduganella umbonata]|uniref:Maltose/moltooligosaccharide transporter n=1 Tax=Pseudoduganella umbonata TaxID=864828 RepID=A0A4P8HQX7_9BURK|nr:MFS transporter [Pseudoduganella umbonata]MBB3220979.1 maltose/moltooligosaccharide transporter [Pseudoduganella umbonata]QCP11576.1 SLC45 family MFS transporter [Pseudoduganella umbonata]
MHSSSTKPRLSFWQLWNMSFGFFGIQFGFALQNANTSRIFSTLGANPDELPLLWLAAPATGLLVQPIIGYLSDNTWHPKWGRRRPFFFFGAVFASLALFLMPNSQALWMAAVVLWMMDAAINVSMEPFRAFVGDKLDESQQTAGFAMQTFFIGCGAVIASLLPTIFTDYLGISNVAAAGVIPDSVRYSFYAGGTVYLLAVLWTVFTADELPPENMEEFQRERSMAKGLGHALAEILGGFGRMPKTMVQLAYVSFFTWVGLYTMWIYTTASVAENVFGTADATSAAYQAAGNWVGIMFAVYSGVSALAAFILPVLARLTSRKAVHMACLAIGGVSLASVFQIHDKQMLMLPMIGVGLAWASILTMPYAILAGSLPAKRMGYYMGLFNFFVVIPQIIAGVVLGFVIRHMFDGHAAKTLVLGGASLLIAAVLTVFVTDSVRRPK